MLTADSIGKSVGARRILTAASLWARGGRISLLLGRNGAGKSTLLRIASGCLQPDYGNVTLAGQTFHRPRHAIFASLGLFYLPDRSLLHRLARVQEHFEALSLVSTVDRTAEAVSRFQLDKLLTRRPIELSHGEQRRVEMALAWARSPRCLVADEPFRGVAPMDSEQLVSALRDMAMGGTAIILSGHDLETLFRIGDEVVWLTAGTTHVLGRVDDAKTNRQFLKEFLTG